MIDILEVPFTGPAAWTGKQMEDSQDWVYTLSTNEKTELTNAVNHAMATGQPLLALGKPDFPLPTLSRRIALLRNALETGRGFELWRGLPVSEWTEDKRAVLFWGLGLQLGRPIVQNAVGDLFGKVTNTQGSDPDTNPNSRFYHTNRAAPFHVDGADVVGLMCIRPARQGGRSLVVSSCSIYNEILLEHSELVELLYEPLWFDHRGERNAVTDAPYWVTSICGWAHSKLSMMYLRNFIESAQRYPGAPPLTDRHRELFDVIDSLAGSDELCLPMDFQPGDIQWLNNHTIMHSRTSFLDWDDSSRRRLLYRLWLNWEERDRFTERYGYYGIKATGIPVHVGATP